MALSTHITARQTQQLAMTPQLRQAIELLQMSALELKKFIDAEVEKNPLLDVETNDEAVFAPREPESSGVDKRFEAALERLPSSLGVDERKNLTENLPRQSTLQDYLLSQLGLIDAPFITLSLAKVLVHELDEDGYLRGNLNNIASRAGVEVTEVKAALKLVQTCEPTGIAARDLAECFSLQLSEGGKLTELMANFLENMDQIAVRPNAKRWSELGIDAEAYAGLLSQIKKLDPAPGKFFHDNFTQFAIPDVTVFRNNLGGWSVELNKSTIPAITVNQNLANEVKSAGSDGAKYVSDCAQRADWLIRSVEQRSNSVLKVAAEIVRFQDGFFSKGVSHLRPMTMKQVAEKVKLNESSVSRITSSKYISCERGTFELKYFFTTAIRSSNGAADTSSASIQKKIRNLIDQESFGKILSDDKISKHLNEEGYDIARRTVTKYREGMNIPSSVERRRFKSNLSKIR